MAALALPSVPSEEGKVEIVDGKVVDNTKKKVVKRKKVVKK